MLLSDAIELAPQELRSELRHWWMLHRKELAEVAVSDIPATAVQILSTGDATDARLEIVGLMDRKTWRAYRDGTTRALEGAAVSQARLVSALHGLGRIGAMALGSILAGASHAR
jgi:hypothetical protein